MTVTKKRLEPRAQTPAPGARESTTTGRLPDDLLSEQAQRLALFGAVVAGLWGLGMMVDKLVPIVSPSFSYADLPFPIWKARVVEILGLLASVAMFVYARYSPHKPETKSEVGLAYLIFTAFDVAMFNSWVMDPPTMLRPEVSWIAVLILIYSMISPVGPRKMLAASLVAASMDPLGVWLAHLRGLPVLSVVDTLIKFWPNYACAVVATLPSHVLQRLGRQLRKAREMGSYQLIELLGQGGMGEVWRAQHRLLARSAAIKLVRPEMLGANNDSDAKLALRRFEREAQATASLSSPHTIRLFDFGVTHEGTFYYVMELLSGRDLESLVREFGPLPPDRAIFLLRQVCHSLADAHARGLVHRDIKPANIYLCRMGLEYDFVKVLDFGLVKFRNRDATSTLITAEHPTTGTPAYMAPEVILGGGDVDRRADVYALGCVAYFLLTGQLVFEADTPMKILMQHVQSRPVPPSQRTELRIPRELDDLVLACLEKDPDKRPQDAEQLLGVACGCKSCDAWTNDAARSWWEQHLPELTGPLTLTEPVWDAGSRAVGVQ
jgi:eukaryotic-like serine/threonine-protein kinase